YSIEKMLGENREKLSGSDVSSLESAIGDARKAMEEGELEGMKTAMDALQKASHKLAEVLYSQAKTDGDDAGPSSTGSEESSSDAAGDDVIEAEVVDEKK
ncbi:MAG: molecular chaperone DnaK, partial [Thermoanaerobaculia bacterium]